MTDLSPAAQAVYSAVLKIWPARIDELAAAALRAAADQVEMNTPLGDTDADAGVFAAHHAIRAHFLAIADELEGADAG